MRALFEARLSDLGPSDFVKVECIACGHVELLSPLSCSPVAVLGDELRALAVVFQQVPGDAISADL
jgi:hypothetical protein